jgi:tetratricopeptide (TPR) repeat protein
MRGRRTKPPAMKPIPVVTVQAHRRPRWLLVGGALAACFGAATLVVTAPNFSLTVAWPWIREHWLTSGALGVMATVLVWALQQRSDRRRDVRQRQEHAHAVETRLRQLLRRHCWIDESSGWLPTTAQPHDPIRLGVHRAAALSTQTAEARLDLPSEVPVYVPRDIDARLDAALAGGGLVILVGDSTAGKTRAAYEAMRRLPIERSLLVPHERESLRALLNEGLDLREIVVWLNDLERFLGPNGLDTALLHRLVGDGTRRVVLLATMRASEYAARDPARESQRSGAERHLLRAERELLEQSHRLDLARRFSREERRRAAERAWDPRIADALAHSGQYGLAEYLAAGPVLWRRWQDAQSVDSPDRFRVGAALVAAALDCRRAGLRRPLPVSLLRSLVPIYLDSVVPNRAGPVVFEEGLVWATEPVQATSALLSVGDGGVDVFDYLLDMVQSANVDRPVPEPLWAHLIGQLQPIDAWSVGIACYWAGRLEYAEQAFQCGVRSADPSIVEQAAIGLGELAYLLDQFAEAERWFHRAETADVSLGDPQVRQVALEQRRELVESERWYRHVAGVGTLATAAAGPASADEPTGRLVIAHEHVALDFTGTHYRQTTRRRLINNSTEPITRYPIRVAVDRYPGDPERSRRHYREHPLDIATLGLRAFCGDELMDWEVKHDLPAFKEIWLLFKNGESEFPVRPAQTCAIQYQYTVSANQWGPWSQRPIRIPTNRLSVEFSFPLAMIPQLSGSQTSLVATPEPLRLDRRVEDGRTIFSWEIRDPPLNARYRFEWQFPTPDASHESTADDTEG